MKKILTILGALLLTMCLSITAYAAEEVASGTCGESLTWILDDEGTLTISGTGAMDEYTASADVPWNDYRSDVKSVVMKDGVTTVGNYAFYDCGNLTKARIPEGVTDIGGRAFYYCKALTDVTIPSTVKTIGYDAFSQCDALPVLVIPDSVTTIGKWAFAGSDSLTKMVIPDSVVSLGECAFWWCDLLEEVVIGDGVTEIGNFTFYNCISLQTVHLGSGVTSICSDVFEGCTNLTQVTFTGDAPGFEGDTVFLNVTATCYYPMGNATWSSEVMQQYGGTLTWTPVSMVKPTVTRIAGPGRCETAIEAANTLKAQLGVDKFNAIILASGSNFADALAGSYLASQRSAPILLYRENAAEMNRAYIRENLTPGGTVYLLGGYAAVPESVETELKDFGITVVRLAGEDRFATNLAILREVGVEAGQELLITTGFNFADSLSASATGKPILLVNSRGNYLTEQQRAFVAELHNVEVTILGGENAVSEVLAQEVQGLMQLTEAPKRLAGTNRYETSVMIAEEYFENVDTVVVAYGKNFPDGLAGGPVAYAMNAPLLLTQAGSESTAAKYVKDNHVTKGYVLGGTAAVTESTVEAIFDQ